MEQLMIINIFSPYTEYGLKGDVRLVVYDTDSKSYIFKEIIKNKDYCEMKVSSSYSKNKLKYKYQLFDGLRWKDTSVGLKFIFEEFNKKTTSKDILKSIDFINNKKFNISCLNFATNTELAYCLKHMMKNIYAYLFKNPNKENIIRTQKYLELFSEDLIVFEEITSHFHSQLSILVSFIKYREESSINIHTIKTDLLALDKIISCYKFISIKRNSVLSGILVAKGNILSIHNRNLAYESYQEAMKLVNGKSYMTSFLSIDAITTYYDQVPEENYTYEIVEDEENRFNKNMNVCFSSDCHYFNMFAPIWAQATFYFKELNFNFGIVAETEKEYQEIITQYKNLRDSFSRFLNIPYSYNNRFFWINSEVINKTVYACARFYLSCFLLKNYPSDVYIYQI